MSEKQKGNKNAALKSGEVGRIQWTQSLSGELVQQFIAYLGIDPTVMSKDDLKEKVAAEGRKLFEEMIEQKTHKESPA